MQRIKFEEWAAKWCAETGTQFVGKGETATASHCASGEVYCLDIRVKDCDGSERSVTLYPGAVAEVCGYLPKGCRRGLVARFVDEGDLTISK